MGTVGRQCSSRHSSRGTVLQGDSPPGGQPSRGTVLQGDSPQGAQSSRTDGQPGEIFPPVGQFSSWIPPGEHPTCGHSSRRTFLPTDIPPAGFLLADIPPADSPPDGQSSRGKVLQGDSPLGGQSSWSFSKHGIPTRPLSQWSTDSCDV